MNKKIIGIFICMMLIGTVLTSVGMINEKKTILEKSQQSHIEWMKTYGGTEFDFLSSVIPTQDGGYLMGGKTYSFSKGIGDVWLIKTDSEGNELWNTSFGGVSYEGSPDCLVELDDGSFIVPTTTSSFGAGDFDIWLIKTDSNGNMLWNKTYGGTGMDGVIVSLCEIDDKGYILSGRTNSYGTGKFDAWLLKTDSEGNEIWNKTYGGPGDEWCNYIDKTDDGGFIVSGEKYNPKENGWIFKINSDGELIWEQTFESKIGSCWINKARQTNDGGYIIGLDTNVLYLGSTTPESNFFINLGKRDIGIIKTDDQGNKVWDNTIGKFIFEDACSDVIQTSDNGFIITGLTRGFGSFIYQSSQYPPYKQACIIKTDMYGNIEWEEYVGNGICFGSAQINENIFVVAGISQPNKSWEGVFIKLN